jgi:hypothetical protein
MMHRLTLVFMIFILCGCSKSSGKPQPRAINGEIDLSGWNFLEDGPVALDGEWFFFWNELLSPDDIRMQGESVWEKARLAKVPGFFVNLIDSDKPSEAPTMQGFGTYLLKVRGTGMEQAMTIARTRLHASSRIYVVGDSQTQPSVDEIPLGVPGKNPESSVPQIVTLPPKLLKTSAAHDFHILIPMSNFHFSKGGISPAPVLNEVHAEIDAQIHEVNARGIAVGIIAALAIYNLTLFIRNRGDRASLALAVFCLLIVWRSLVPLLFDGPGVFDLAVSYKTFYSTTLLCMLFFGYFLYLTFPSRMQGRWLLLLSIVCLAYALFVLCTPPLVFSRTVLISHLILVSASLYFLIGVLRAVRARDQGAWESLIGGICLLACLALDILNAFEIRIGWGSFTEFGVATFLFMQSQIIGIRFAEAFRKVKRLSKSLQDEVDIQTRDIRSILKSIRQGIFSINAHSRKTDEQSSEFLKELLQVPDPAHKDLRELLLSRSNLEPDTVSTVEAAVEACLGEPAINFELNEGNFIHEIQLQTAHGSSIVEVDWAPIINKENIIEKLLICLRDVTQIRELERNAMAKDRELLMLLEIINLPEDRFRRFMKSTKLFLAENARVIQESTEQPREAAKKLFINMHTIKGGARTYALKSLANAAHCQENHYARITTDPASWNQAEMLHGIQGITAIINGYETLAEEKLGWNLNRQEIRVAKDTLETTIHQLEEITVSKLDPRESEALHQAQSMLLGQCFTRVSAIVDELKTGLQSIARDLQKPAPDVVIQEGQVWLHDEAANIIHSCLIHILRNSLDHGLESPGQREKEGKSVQGRISIDVSIQDDGLLIDVSDDGCGLNLRKLKNLGQERKLLTQPNPTVVEIAGVILESGFSTKTEVTEISGRGVGLDAVRSFLQGYQGSLEIMLGDLEDLEKVPFVLRLRLPRKLGFDFIPTEKGSELIPA